MGLDKFAKTFFVFLSLLVLFSFSGVVSAQDLDRVEGYSWSSNVGWISFSCHNSNSCGSSNYGVTLDRETGSLGGHAWNSDIGWISFKSSDVAGCPSVPCAPKVVEGNLTGWAKATGGDTESGWEGWIHLSGSGYGVSFDDIRFRGYSWSDEVVGWMKWDPAFGPGVFSISSSVLTTGISGGGSNSDVRVGSNVCGTTTCSYSYESGETVNLLANAGSGFIFSEWTGADASDCPSLVSRICDGVIVSADKEIKATFRPVVCPADGPGFCPACKDGADNDGDGKVDFPQDLECPSGLGLTESLVVAACSNCIDDDGDGKIDWLNDSGCNDDPTDNNELNASLDVTIAETGGANGRVISDLAGIDCEPNCEEDYTNNEQVKLTALPLGNGSNFWRWSGACEGSSPTCSLSMVVSRAVTAHFGATAEPNCPSAGIGFCPECNDDHDNDDDGDIDWPDDEQCVDPNDESEEGGLLPQCPSAGPGLCPQCNDDEDNDDDGDIDFPDDSQCSSLLDNTEGDTSDPSCPLAGVGICPQCNDDEDNDGDGKVDFPQDLQCTSKQDESESGSGINCPSDGPGLCPACNDGEDNDGDGVTDFPNDLECSDPADDDESGGGVSCPAGGLGVCPQCNDGEDNDGDGKADYPLDMGCFNRVDNNETDPTIIGNCPADGPELCPRCNDGIDNDEDGLVDWAGFDADKNGTREIPRDPSCQGEPNKDTEAGGIDVIEV